MSRKCCIFAKNFRMDRRSMKRREEQFAPLWELNELWETLTEEEKTYAAEHAEVVYYEKNELIHSDGDESLYMWMLLRGKVRIFKEGIGQRQQIIRLLKPYDIFGQNGAFCYQVMLMMAKDLAFSEIQTVNLTQKHIRGRLAESLLLLLKNYGYEEDGHTLAMLLPREDLANMSNMTTSNAIRTLSQFAQEGLLAIDGRHIQILDEKSLEKISRLG